MLLLTRKSGQKIYIGDDIILTVKWIYKTGEVQFKLDTPAGTSVRLPSTDLPTESVSKPVVKWKRALSSLVKLK